METFETGTLGSRWMTSGSASWSVTSSSPIAGSYSARSGVITHSQSTNLQITLNFVSAGTVSFQYRTSTESSFDYVTFYVDGVQQMRWSGTTGPTTFTSTSIAAGSHTLRWTYSKDGSVTSGSDTVWIDNISALTAS
jgi:hypothetical protein